YGAPTEAEFAFVEELRLAVIDSAAAVSLARTDPSRRAPLRSTSRGVGELIRAAADLGARGIILGVGGTASSDGGAGAAAALGLRLLDANAATLPDQAVHLVRLARIEDHVAPSLSGIAIRIAVDVQNRLTGADGAAAVYGAQKGLQSWEAPALDAAMRAWAGRVRADLGREIEHVPGAGAGGGIPAGILAALPGASIESGAALVGDAVGLRDHIAAADLVITGEGSLDAQTA
ncbi:MAG: glycerate kinase, partial [Dehalococcoidia bacterium]|nr:glycerate kinase [Dehalococcoidia bacterium]